jgi:hypothetical protein
MKPLGPFVLRGDLRVTVNDTAGTVLLKLPAESVSGSNAYVAGTVPPGDGPLFILCVRIPAGLKDVE